MLNKIKSRLSSGKKQNHYLFFLKGIFVSIILTHLLIAQTISVSGLVTNEETGKPIVGANIVSGDVGTTTDKDGQFSLTIPEKSKITISFIGFKSVTISPSWEFITVRLTPTVIKGEEVYVLANRAVAGVTPVAFSTLTPEEINVHYTVEDVPMVLASEPGVYAYSESGNGTGYSYVSIRGFDQSRIAVMLDNVPLNDNESHQVYWVDHGDILSDAQDVQIQRGIGNSIYGATAFGGSINVISEILSDEERITFDFGGGSYNTSKLSARYKSGKRLGNRISLSLRTSQIESDGYRKYHHSLQRAFSFGAEYRGDQSVHQLRGLIGYENTDLLWDGVYGDAINDKKLRREGYRGFTDDFLQQIYSLNSQVRISDYVTFHNVAYLVMGRGYYEAEKYGKSFYKYNLDTITDTSYADSVTDLLRRKWIVNHYFGIIPQFTWKQDRIRIDLGSEIRFYSGDHFGNVSKFSNPLLSGFNEFKYYQYLGTKRTLTVFSHILYKLTDWLFINTDLQLLRHDWNMDQEPIGHAAGHQISADWTFFNPRLGFTLKITDRLSMFGNYGKAEKEPGDDQIINADEWEFEPKGVYPELIYDAELGLLHSASNYFFNLNLYQITLKNEVMETISFEEEGYYEYSQAVGTIHQGIEFESGIQPFPNLSLNANGILSQNIYTKGELEGNLLPNRPGILANLTMNYTPVNGLKIFGLGRYVGKRYIDPNNIEENSIKDYTVVDVGCSYQWKNITISAKVNNLLDTLYVTHGEDWGWGWVAYWPGATRNVFVSIQYQL